MKQIDENVWYSLLLLVFYILLMYVDAKWFVPRMLNKCKGAMTEQQTDMCYHWIYTTPPKETGK